MSMLRAIRTLNAIETGALNAASLEALLADAGRLSEWSVLVGLRGQVERMLASPFTMGVVCGSARAIKAFMANPRARAALYTPDFLSIFAPSAWGVYAPYADQFELGGTGGNEVMRWRNALGVTARDMVQATSASRPLLSLADSPSVGLLAPKFDGTDDVLACTEAFNQPTAYTILAVHRRGVAQRVGLIGDTNGGVGVDTNNTAIYAGASTAKTFSNASAAANVWGLDRYRRQSAAAFYHSLNGGTESTAATIEIPSISGPARIGAAYLQGDYRYNGAIAEVWLIAGSGDAASPEVVRVTNLLKFKYGL